MRNLFVTVMEADGNELQPFDEEQVDTTQQSEPNNSNDMMGDDPPPLNENSDNDLSFDGNDSSAGNEFDDNATDDGNDDTNPEEDKKNHDDLSGKANNILNQQLYEQMISYNNDLSTLLDNLQTIIPVLPYETTNEIDKYSVKLQETLATSKNYVINKFIDAQYGENLLFFEKVKSLCSILKDQINKSLKHIEKS